MKITGFLVIGFFAIMVIAVGFVYFGENSEYGDTPQILDKITIEESVQINPNADTDILDVKETVVISSNDGGYWIDEDGKRHYSINARDAPVIQD